MGPECFLLKKKIITEQPRVFFIYIFVVVVVWARCSPSLTSLAHMLRKAWFRYPGKSTLVLMICAPVSFDCLEFNLIMSYIIIITSFNCL